MKKSLIALAVLAACAAATAGTVYRDRMIPPGVCMVEFNKIQINANLIQEITIGSRKHYKWEGFPRGSVELPPYQSLRVTLVNNQMYEIQTGDLAQQQRDFLKLIKDGCR